MAGPTFGTSGVATGGSTRSTISLAAPTSVVSGSVLVAVLFIDGATNLHPTLAGWAEAENSPVFGVGSGSNHLHVLWHRASGSEAGPYAFVMDASSYCEGQVHRYDGAVATGVPFDSPTSSAASTVGQSASPAVSVATAGADRLLLHAATNWLGGTFTAPTGFAKRQQISPDNLSTLSDMAQAVQGSSGTVSATCTGAGKSTAWLGAMMLPASNLPPDPWTVTAPPQPYTARRRAANF